MPETLELETPLLLLAMPQVLDPFFHRSVVLLVHHQEEGSLGFIVNRPTGIKVSEILNGLEIVWQGRGELLAYFGGPVQPQLGTVLYRVEGAPASGENEIFPGLALTQHIGDLQSLAEKPPGSFRLFLGYAGWGEGQLMQEIQRNDWLIAPVANDLIFTDDPTDMWHAGLASVGVDPAQLPSWTPSNGNGSAN